MLGQRNSLRVQEGKSLLEVKESEEEGERGVDEGRMVTGEGGGEWRVSLLKPEEAHGGSKVEVKELKARGIP